MKAKAALTAIAAAALLLAGCGDPPNKVAPPDTTPNLSVKPDGLGIPKSSPISGPEPGEVKSVNLPSGREFLVHLPADYDSSKDWPLLFAFHGYGQDNESMRTGTSFDDAEAISVYPLGKEKAWAPAPYAKTTGREDLKFVDDMIDALRATYSVDDDAIYAAGMSNGGGFTAYLGCQRPDVFAGIASVSAAYYDAIHKGCSDKPLSRLDIHGTDDPIISYFGGTRHDTPYNSVPDVLSEDARRNQCDNAVDTTRISTTAFRQSWVGCEKPLVHIRIGGGSHTWPGGSTDKKSEDGRHFATDRILDFFHIPGRPDGTEDKEKEIDDTPKREPSP